MNKRRFSDKLLCEALIAAKGVVAIAAEMAHCSRVTVTERIRTSAKVAAACEQAREERLDLAESKLLEALEAGEPWAIKFFLTMKGQPRGYSETHVLEVVPPPQVMREELGDAKIKRLLEMRIGPRA